MSENSIIFNLDDEMEIALLKFREEGLQRGAYCGFSELYEHYSLKEGSTTYIVAPPYSGKTVFINELMMNLAEFEGWKWVVFSPETGSPRDLFAELLWVKLRKPFVRFDAIRDAKDNDVATAIEFIRKHFFILDPLHADLNERIYFKAIEEVEKKYDVKINGTVIDPVTDFEISGQQRDLALGSFLTRVRKFSSGMGIHSILAFHTKAMGYVEGNDINGNKVRYLPPATMFDVAGGEMASRKGMFILSLWRTPYNVIDKDTGLPYISNETRVTIHKAKPKAIGKLGTVKLYYDALSSRYYEYDGDTKVFSQPQKTI